MARPEICRELRVRASAHELRVPRILDDPFREAKQYKEEVRRADILGELLRAGKREVSLSGRDKPKVSNNFR